jgi:hypothetical protein
MDFCAVVLGEANEGEHICLGFIHQCGKLSHLGAQLTDYRSLLVAHRLGVVLHEGGVDEGCDDALALLRPAPASCA